MIRAVLIFIAFGAAVTIYNAAHRASIDTALQLALIGTLGFVAGMLWEIQRTEGD